MTAESSIKKTVILFVTGTSAILIVLYSVMVGDYFLTGLDIAVQQRLESEMCEYRKAYLKNPDTPLPQSAYLNAYAGWKNTPDRLQNEFDIEDLPEGIITGNDWAGEDSDFYYYVLPWTRPDGVTIYFVDEWNEKTESPRIDKKITSRIHLLVIAAGIVFFTMVGMAVFLFRHIVKPVQGISRWAEKLDKTNLDDPVNFTHLELNELAVLFRESLRRQMAGVEREHSFLRNASHELRTPITVLQNNLGIIKRLKSKEDPRYEASLGRMNNAVSNMRNVIMTLLWVSREKTELLETAQIELKPLVSEIIKENDYLLKGKDNRIHVELDSTSCVAPEEMLRIILNNIIRNAFQYTFGGDIYIHLDEKELYVLNDSNSEKALRVKESYGVGLMLIKQLVGKLGLELTIKDQESCFLVRLILK